MKEEKPDSIDLNNPEFQDVMRLVNHTSRSVFMTGKAGTGKSTFLRYLTANTKKKHIILAPTGIAAVNAGGVTLHSFFKIPLKPLLPDDPDFSIRRIRQRLKYPSSLIKLIREIELIVIDEISMVRADILDFIDKVLRVYCRNMRMPFGGKQLLLVGDVFQLEPVATNESKTLLSRYYPSLYFFSAMVFRQTVIIPIELSKIYRQNETHFISILDRIRLGKATMDDINALNLRVIPSKIQEQDENNQDDFTITLATQRNMVDAINDFHLERIRMPEITYYGEITGDFPESSMPAPMELKVKNGAQIVFIRNDVEHRWVNGTIGKVLNALPDSLEIELEDGTDVIVQEERWSHIRYDYDEKTHTINEVELGTFTQLPVRLAWAMTIHKSQGLTFKKAIIDLGRGAFAGGQTYVALSRCRSLDGLLLKSPIRMSDIFVRKEIMEFSQWFNNRSLVESAIEEARLDASFADAAKMWNSGKEMEAAKLFLNSCAKKNVITDTAVRRLICTKLAVIRSKDTEIADLKRQLRERELKLRHLALDSAILGDDCLGEEDYAGAIEHYNRALTIMPDIPEGLRGKGKVLLLASEADAAIDVLEKLAGSPFAEENDFILLYQANMATGNLSDAFNTLLKGKELFEKSIPILTNLAGLYDDMGDHEEATVLKHLIQKIKKQKKR